ncbi:MAG: TonB-dependent receptor [Myxococcales bacterium]|nr:TonB-dependent receptor [Myxococcales bacterium]
MIGVWLAAHALAAPVQIRVVEREDGDPISGARVRVADAEPVVTSADGRATVSVAGAGPWVLVAEAEGRTSVTIEVVSTSRVVRIWMPRGEAALEVVVEGLKRTPHPTRHAVDGEQAMETPGTLDDAIRLASSLPGVTVQREYSPTSGDLSVRGSQRGDSRYYLDGIEIPYLYHFNQYASVFPASQVGVLELFPSTFGAQYGDAVGAIVEARSRQERPNALHGGAHINFVMAGGDVRAPLGDKWWLSASGRRSYQDLAGEQTEQFTAWPTFYDFVARAERTTDTSRLGVFAVGAADAYTRATGELDVLDPFEATVTPSLQYSEGFQVGGVRAEWAQPRFQGRSVAAVVRHRRRGILADLGSEDLQTVTLSSRTDASARTEGGSGIDAGYEINVERTSLTVAAAGPAGIRVAEEAPALARGANVDDARTRARGGIYGTGHLAAGPLQLMPGVRIGGDTAGGGLQLEPRAAVRLELSDDSMLKLGGGRYTQRPDTEHLFEGTGSPDLPTTTSWQVSAGWEQAIAGRFEVGLDAYYKTLTNPLLFPIDGPALSVPRGHATGVELLTRYRLRELFFLWGWIAVQRTRLTDADGIRFAADGDQLLSGGLVASWDVGRWNFGARYRYATGLPFTPIDGSLYDAGRDDWVALPGRINTARMPTYHKVDVRAAYTWELRGWSLSAVAEIWYVPPSANQLYPTWNYDFTEQGWVVGPGVLPLLGLRARF